MWQTLGPHGIAGHTPGVGGSGAGKLNAFAYDPANAQVMYVGGGIGPGNSGPGSEAGVYQTLDGGLTWQPKDNGLTSTAVDSLWLDPKSPSTLLATTWGGGIFRTINAGDSWSQVLNSGDSTAIAQSGIRLYVATAQGVVESTDAGVSWRLVKATTSPVEALVASQGLLWAGLGNGVVLRGIERTGRWSRVESDLGHSVWSIAVDPRDRARVLVVEWLDYSAYDLVRTTNGGRTWSTSALMARVAAQVVEASVNAADTFYAGSDGRMFRSRDGGATWKALRGTGDIRYLFSWPGDAGTIVAAGDQGIYRTVDAAKTWNSLNGDLSNSLLYSVSVSGSEILSAAQDYGSVESTDAGTSWIQPGRYCEGGTSAINPENSQYQYLFTECGFFVSSDGGTSFTSVPALSTQQTLSTQNSAIAFDAQSPGVVYVVGSSGVWESSDWGVDFTLEKSWPSSTGSAPTAIAVSPTDGSDIVLATFQGVYVTTDAGASWTQATGVPGLAPGSQIVALAIDPANPQQVVAGLENSSAIYLSSDGGQSFTRSEPFAAHSSTDWSGGVWALSFEPGVAAPLLAAAGPTIGVYVSSDVGATWQSAQGNAVTQMFTGLQFSGGYLYASTVGQGVLRAPVAGLTSTSPT